MRVGWGIYLNDDFVRSGSDENGVSLPEMKERGGRCSRRQKLSCRYAVSWPVLSSWKTFAQMPRKHLDFISLNFSKIAHKAAGPCMPGCEHVGTRTHFKKVHNTIRYKALIRFTCPVEK